MLVNPPAEILLLDTDTLSHCVDAGVLGPRAAYVVNPQTAALALKAVADAPQQLVTTETIYRESVLNAPFGIASTLKQWFTDNKERIAILPTFAGSLADPDTVNPGERSLAELLDPARSQHQSLTGRPYMVASDDLRFKWEDHGIKRENVLGIAALLNTLLKAGTLLPDNYIIIRDGLIACPMHINGVKPSTKHPVIVLPDEEAKKYQFQAPVIMPDQSDMRITIGMAKPIRPAKP